MTLVKADTRAEKDSFVLRLAVKLYLAAFMVFGVFLPVVNGDNGSRIASLAKWLGVRFMEGCSLSCAALILTAMFVRPLRIPAGLLCSTFVWTMAGLLRGEYPTVSVSLFLSGLLGLSLAVTGIPEKKIAP